MDEQAFENPGEAWQSAMAEGDFERAWEINDRVLQSRDRAGADDPTLPYHLRFVWDGRPVEGRSVLVRCYHGLGDTLQFCRYLAPLRRRARHVTLEVQPALVSLLATLPGPDRIVAFDPANPLPPDECNLEIMELAHALRLRPDRSPYFSVDADRSPGLRIGLCWQASQTWRPERSLPGPAAAEIVRWPGVNWVSLQRGAAIAGLADDCPADILLTARRIAGLDLVISVDTMIAHLAGALGVPLRLVLSEAPDWRWLAGSGGSVWYRDVRQYRQPRPGQWSPALARLQADLRNEGTLPLSVGF